MGVVEALGRIASPAALEAARQQLRSGTEGRDFVFKLYMTLLTSAFLMTAAIRDAGQLAQLSDAGALRFGSAVALAVKAMPGGYARGHGINDPAKCAGHSGAPSGPCAFINVLCMPPLALFCLPNHPARSPQHVTGCQPRACPLTLLRAVLLDGFVEWAVREEGSTVQAGRWLADVEGIVRTGTTLLMHGVEDVLAGPSQRGLRQQLQPRLQRAMQAAVLRPQQLVEWLTSMAAAARVLFHLKGEPRHSTDCWHGQSGGLGPGSAPKQALHLPVGRCCARRAIKPPHQPIYLRAVQVKRHWIASCSNQWPTCGVCRSWARSLC